MFGSKRKPITDLPDEEWNFSEILEEDAEACLRYELAREIEHPETYFSAFSSRDQAPFALDVMPLTPNEEREASLAFKEVRATMYILPFDVAHEGQELGCRELLSGLYFLHPDKSLRGYPASLREKPWLALDASWQANLQSYTEQFLAGIAFCALDGSSHQEKRQPASTDKPFGSGKWQTLTTKIDWSKGDPSLIEGFTAWLQKQRPKAFPSTSWTGRQSTTDSLNAVSALRLRHHLSIEDAMKHTKIVSGRSIYGDQSSWDRAQKRAIQLFAKTFPDAGSPKSESRMSNRKGQNPILQKQK